jgi:tetratricopeptide (TPR) repeat protein
MLLQLSYRENQHAGLNAAFIAGGSAYDWLAVVSNWKLDPKELQCFILPESIGSNKAGGLFVIFKQPALAAKLSLRSPYTQLAAGFYIPLHSILLPEVTVAELTRIKLWDLQVFHPFIGLTGFEQKDEVLLSDLIEVPEQQDSNWLPAWPQAKPYPRLNSIRLEPEETPFHPDTIMEQLPLNEIPDVDKEQQTFLKKALRLLGTVGLWVLLILAAIGKIIFEILAAIFGRRSRPGTRVSQGKKSWLSQLNDWVNKRLADLKKQRDSELNRLVKLFDKNNDEALLYAIPLNSPYLNRGTAPPGAKLSRRSLNLNLRSFGGGGKVDAWDLGDFRETLRQQYTKAAHDNIEKGDYKKAAYVYAHLLGNLPMAAQTLQNGKLYREAAIIYKDHLNNPGKAAECLETGGLLNEAIPIYVELGSYEKAGDLYVQLGQEQLANKYYNDTVKRMLDVKDYLNAARLKAGKMGELAEGQTILLNGWKDNNQPEKCLAKYFDQVPAEALGDSVKEVYERQVNAQRETSLLKVLADLLPAHKDEQFRDTALEISYEIVHQQITRGDHSGLNLLSNFLPGDRLLARDASTFMLQNHRKAPSMPASSYIQLWQDTRWVSIINYHDQLLGVGVNEQGLHLFRANWDGKIAYEFLFRLIKPNPAFQLIADAQMSSQVLLAGNDIPQGLHKKLEAYSYFEQEIDFFQLNWTLPGTLGYGLKNSDPDGVFILHIVDENICIDLFSYHGSLLDRTYCAIAEVRFEISSNSFLRSSEMYWRNEHFYFIGQDRLMRVNIKGQLEMLLFESEVVAFSVSSPHAALKIAVLTAKGPLIVSPDLKEMKISMPAFAGDVNPSFIQLLPDSTVVIANEKVAMAYDISGPKARFICEIHPEHPIRQILSVPKRHHFALLESDNRISIHSLEEDVCYPF